MKTCRTTFSPTPESTLRFFFLRWTCTNICFVNFETSRRRLLSLALSRTHNLLSLSLPLFLFLACTLRDIRRIAPFKQATLEEIRQAASRICRDYLTGRWKVVTPEQLVVKRIRWVEGRVASGAHAMKCNWNCLFPLLCTVEAYRISCIT